MHVLLDTGPLVALLNKRDAYHTWSVENAAKLAPPFYTCEAVLAEAHFLLSGTSQGQRRLIELLASGKIELTTFVKDELDRIGRLMITYANVPMDFADACLVCMAEQVDGTVFTLDGDFRIYRKNRTQQLKLLIP